jgi:hypothetical protein
MFMRLWQYAKNWVCHTPAAKAKSRSPVSDSNMLSIARKIGILDEKDTLADRPKYLKPKNILTSYKQLKNMEFIAESYPMQPG